MTALLVVILMLVILCITVLTKHMKLIELSLDMIESMDERSKFTFEVLNKCTELLELIEDQSKEGGS